MYQRRRAGQSDDDRYPLDDSMIVIDAETEMRPLKTVSKMTIAHYDQFEDEACVS